MATKFESRIALVAKKHGLQMVWQDIKFGYRRARFSCESYEEMNAILDLLHKIEGVWTDSWCRFEGEFEGYVYAMNRNDRKQFESEQMKEQARVEDWWMRYHVADKETRRLMACGEIK